MSEWRELRMYWLISLPVGEGTDVVWTRVQSKVRYESELSQIYRFKLPELRVGTLDSLLALSDDLVKVRILISFSLCLLLPVLYNTWSSTSRLMRVNWAWPTNMKKSVEWSWIKSLEHQRATYDLNHDLHLTSTWHNITIFCFFVSNLSLAWPTRDFKLAWTKSLV